MTLPQNVKDAMESADANGGLALVYMERDDYKAIRAQLMSQEAEIELLRVGCERNLLHAQMAESRLAAANALLRKAIEWNWLDEDAPQQAGVNVDIPSVMDDLYLKIQAHLQGAGDEGGRPA